MRFYDLTDADRDAVEPWLGRALPGAGADWDLVHIDALARELPAGLQDFLRRCRFDEVDVVLVRGFEVDPVQVGPTPAHWRDQDPGRTRREEAYLLLLGSLLGEVFGWATQQDGRLVNDILPVAGQEHEQLGTGSSAVLTWHTEDAFHPCRADWLGLLCLRNPDRVSTTVGAPRPGALDPRARAVLAEPRFTIRPDLGHTAQYNSGQADADSLFDRISLMDRRPEPVAVLSGPADEPYLRVDPEFLHVADGDEEAASAVAQLIAEIDGQLRDLPMRAGEAAFLNNQRVVHGRRAFCARHDGTDRWLKRINVTRDLTKSRHCRTSISSRSIL